MAKTYRDRLIAGLKSKGWVEDKADRSHYTAFTRVGSEEKMFVGANGALRKGECATKSWSVGDATRQRTAYSLYLQAGDQVLDPIFTLGDDIPLPASSPVMPEPTTENKI